MTSYTYDADGDVTTVTDPAEAVTAYQYDDEDRPTATTVDGAVTSAQTYDLAGQVATQSDAPGQVTRYQYNLLGRFTTMTDPLGAITRYSYDPAGNLTRSVDPSGQPTYYAYDAAGELTAEGNSPAGLPAETFSYTRDGQQAQVSNPAGTITYSYDADQRLLAATQTTPASVSDGYSYRYADAADRVFLTYPNGQVATSYYDKAGELTKVTDWLGDSMTFGYDASGNLTSETLPGGITISYGSSAITVARYGTTMAVIAYSRNNDGLVSEAAAEGVPGGSANIAHYHYTPRGELATDGTLRYSYDPAGDLASATAGTGFTQSYNAADELTTRLHATESPPASVTTPMVTSLAPAIRAARRRP